MVIKKVPGAGEVYMVYDKRDRIVATSSATSRLATYTGYCFWNFTLYDALNRPVATGEMHTCMSLSQMIAYVNGLNNTNTTITSQPGPAVPITAYNPIVGNAICTLCSNWSINSIIHYDDYAGLPAGLSDYLTTWNTNFSATNNIDWPYAQMPAKSSSVTGMQTWTATRVLGSTNFLNTALYYDDKGRVIQTQSTNITGGVDVATTQYSWAGQALVTVQKQEKAGAPAQTTVVVSKMTYDDLNRLVKTEKKLSNTLVNGNAMSAYNTVSTMEYDALGQMKKKTLGSKKDPATGNYYVSRQPLASLDYEYNIRGWLLSINKNYITATTNNDQYFGMQLGYDKNGVLGTFTNKQYNGNISGTLWKSEGDKQQREYDFNYDAANRLTSAMFGQYVSGSGSAAIFNTSAGINFTTDNLAYDANGNILTMRQYGLKGTTSAVIDDMIYTYLPKSNKLLNVRDAQNDALSKLGDFKTSSIHPQSTAKTNATTQALRDGVTDYTYDADGNMIKDFNKDISTPAGTDGIKYNHLNLPILITIKKDAINNKGTIAYTYDAAGNKLQKTTIDISTAGKTITTTTKYVGGFVYESKTIVPADANNPNYTDVLQFVPHEEGRIRFKPANNLVTPAIVASFQYDYMLKDHLGNIRTLLTEEVQADTYPTLSLEGNSGSTEVNNQNTMWEKANGQNFDVTSSRTNPSPVVLTNATLAPAPLSSSLLVRSSTGKIGAGKLLKVMSGDKIHTTVQYYYSTNTNSGSADGLNTLATNLVTSLANSMAAGAAIKLNPSAYTSLLSADGAAIAHFAPQNTPTGNGRPKAFLNVLFFDEQFKFDATSSYSEQIGTSSPANPGQIVIALGTAKQAKKNGYCYLYISNESNDMVYFDNFTLKHERSSLIEETHYYPFGLRMEGICSKAAGSLRNRYQFNGGNELQNQEFSDGSGLETYDATNRMYDVQLGRFFQPDELAESHWEMTPYNFSANNPIRFNDPLGLKEGDPNTPIELPEVVVKSVKKLDHNQMQTLYWSLRDRGIGFDKVASPVLRARLERWDGISRHMERVHQMTRDGDIAFLNAASWVLPAGHITKLRYLKFAGILFKVKRGATVGGKVAGKIVTNFGEAFFNEASKEILANRGNFFTVDWHDVLVSTATDKLGVAGKAWIGIYNSLVDVNVQDGVQVSGFQKSNGGTGLDLMFSGLKSWIGSAAQSSASESTQKGIEVMLDQVKKTISDVAN